MKNLKIKDKNNRMLFFLLEKQHNILKSIVYNDNLRKETVIQEAQKQLMLYPKNSSICRIRNRCVLTNRPRAVYRFFKMSRIMFRKLALEGKIIGVKKSSW